MGLIARPTLGSSKWNGEDTFRIVGTAQSVRGTKVMRVGSQSGSSEGEVSATCKNLNVQSSNVTYLCQVLERHRSLQWRFGRQAASRFIST